jgi:HAD superfamily hydrolase (TIGR01549 family)
MPIRAVIFDIGGVLFRIDDHSPWRKWESRLGLEHRQLSNIVFDNPVSHQAFVGQVSADEAWNETARQLGLMQQQLDAMKIDFWAAGSWDTDLLGFIRTLRPLCKTGIISDAWSDAREATKEYINSSLFDVILFSAEEGAVKPAPEIFRRALSRLDVDPGEAIFVDDRQKNVDGALEIGMHGIQFTDSRSVRDEIQRCCQPS